MLAGVTVLPSAATLKMSLVAMICRIFAFVPAAPVPPWRTFVIVNVLSSVVEPTVAR
jgi:hypothetical protein